MSEKKRFMRNTVWGLAAVAAAGIGFLWLEFGKMNAPIPPEQQIPAFGFPSPPEFVELLDEARHYWRSRLDSAVLLENIPPLPVLYVADMKDVSKDEAELEEKVFSVIGKPAAEPEKETSEKNITEPPYAVETPDKVPIPPMPEEIASPVLEPEPSFRYEIETETLEVEGVLVPQKTTVISSSRDGKIRDIFVDNGDVFRKNDILLAYDCQDLNAEIEAIKALESLTKEKVAKGAELFKLDIISGLEQRELEVEQMQTQAKNSILSAQLEACVIRASYNGRVVKRLANPEEYTRTDRVLMQVASRDPLEVEFIVPSKWLRYLDVGAPVEISVAETDQVYQARIKQIFGEVDPVSQSIQMSAGLLSYDDPLLPGMSGVVKMNARQIREEGIKGFLEKSKRSELKVSEDQNG
jgi:RND family efflux transporter MFP subunit